MGIFYSDNTHPTVTIERKTSTDQYFVFLLNDRLRILQSIDSPTLIDFITCNDI